MLRHERFIFLIVLYCTLCKLCLGGKVCRKQLESIPARSTVIADECSRSIHAILSTVFTGGCAQMQLRKQSVKIPKLIFWCIFIFLLVFCEKWNII